jgi:hypothetical protein
VRAGSCVKQNQATYEPVCNGRAFSFHISSPLGLCVDGIVDAAQVPVTCPRYTAHRIEPPLRVTDSADDFIDE